MDSFFQRERERRWGKEAVSDGGGGGGGGGQGMDGV